ncbi:MAG: iron-containing alcohol dehydrogenase [Megasphaera sp.]|uniref:iron-containing alcohol dehydrogenase n=1 Tax=Megasphaera sp. TaxID=2023260 RepID=UPI003EFD27B1
MENFIFENSTKAYFGKKCVSQYLPDLLSQYGRHVILAYGGGSIKRTGIYDEIMGILKAAGKDVVEFSGIMANPTYDKVLEGAALARQNQADLILAVGGGSVMDCCKAVALAAVYDGDIWQDFWAKPGRIEVTPVPLGIIMTTSGTGSEMNGGAVITNEALKIKTGRDYPQLNARFALLDPLYTYTVPKKQMISGAFDSFTHMMETYFSAPDEDNVSDSINEALMKSVVRNLRKAIADPEDYEARSNLVWASTMAENRILKLGKQGDFQGHILEHALGAFTDCNHGCGLAVLLPVYYRHIEAAGAKKFARFATEVWGFSPEGKTLAELANDGVEALVSFVKEIGLPTTLRELGMTEDQKDLLPKIAATCVASPGSYKHLDGNEILDIFKEAW